MRMAESTTSLGDGEDDDGEDGDAGDDIVRARSPRRGQPRPATSPHVCQRWPLKTAVHRGAKRSGVALMGPTPADGAARDVAAGRW